MDNWEQYFAFELENYEREYLKSIKDECIDTYKRQIDSSLYKVYSPTSYQRNEDLKNNIRVNMNGNEIEIYHDNLTYTSAIDGTIVGDSVIDFVNYGHSDSTGIDNMYHNYEGRHFKEDTKEELENKFNVKVEIVK